jgi:glutamate racemase
MIGVFDSGVGGLTVLKNFLTYHPGYNYIYLGDKANVPYGGKSSDVIYGYTKKAIDFLYKKNCKLIIVACNSASAQALRRIQEEYLPLNYPDLRVLGVVRPIAEKIASLKKVKKVGIIGTKATINSSIYLNEIRELKPEIEVYQRPTPLLVPLIEEGWAKKPETKMILRKYLRALKVKQVDALVLACTHYPFLLKDIKRIMGKRCVVMDSGKDVSDSLGVYLSRHRNLNLSESKEERCIFYTTDDVENFKKMGEFFLGRKIIKIEKVDLP